MEKKKLSRFQIIKTIHLTTLALPAIVLVFIFSYIPMGGLIVAFKDYNVRDGILGSPWIGLKNFEFFFRNDAFNVTRNTILYNLAFIVVGLVASLAFALMLNELTSRKLTKFYQTTFFFPYFFSWVIVAYMVYSFMAPNGIIPSNGVISGAISDLFGFDIKEFYVTSSIWPVFLVLLNTWKNLGYSSVLYYAAIMGISTDYYEAAEIDGASRLQRIRYITLPLLLPLVSIMTLLNIGSIFRSDFGLFWFVPREIGKLFAVTSVIDVHVYRMLRLSNDIGMSAAIGFYQSVLCFALVLLSNYAVKKLEPEYAAF
ncbi:MAG: ABC transporter permease subunit [Oscillospiraceae bacterium]|nr:ABC transporter permease subunit [Oscillospiraceae bacterium]